MIENATKYVDLEFEVLEYTAKCVDLEFWVLKVGKMQGSRIRRLRIYSKCEVSTCKIRGSLIRGLRVYGKMHGSLFRGHLGPKTVSGASWPGLWKAFASHPGPKMASTASWADLWNALGGHLGPKLAPRWRLGPHGLVP